MRHLPACFVVGCGQDAVVVTEIGCIGCQDRSDPAVPVRAADDVPATGEALLFPSGHAAELAQSVPERVFGQQRNGMQQRTVRRTEVGAAETREVLVPDHRHDSLDRDCHRDLRVAEQGDVRIFGAVYVYQIRLHLSDQVEAPLADTPVGDAPARKSAQQHGAFPMFLADRMKADALVIERFVVFGVDEGDVQFVFLPELAGQPRSPAAGRLAPFEVAQGDARSVLKPE